MSTINFCGFESGDFSECAQNTATVSIQTSTVRTGGYALRSNPAGAGTGYVILGSLAADGTSIITADKGATAYHRFYFNYATKPASTSENFFQCYDTASAVKLEIRLTSAGHVAAYDSTDTLIATGSTTLSSGTWYRIEVKCGTGASAAWEVKINGTSEISSSNANLGTTNHGYVTLGKTTNRNSNSVDFFYDDWLWSDAAYPGPGQCTVQVPIGDGFYTQGTAHGVATKWGCLTDIPNDGDTSYVNFSGGFDEVYTSTMQATGTVGISGTINSQKTVIIARRDSVSNSVPVFRTRSGTTNSDTSAANAGASYVAYCKINDNDPNTSAAWLTGGLDAIQCGVEDQSTGFNPTRYTAAYSMVDYTPTGGGGGGGVTGPMGGAGIMPCL